jgi:hypothetical protein
MENFKEHFSRSIHDTGTQYLVRYPNGYGASIVKHKFSYGGDKGLWELAVTKYKDNEAPLNHFEICYNTPITGDVLGHLKDDEVNELLEQIKNLDKHG